MKRLFILFTALFFALLANNSCGPLEEDMPDEDYDALFPYKKPDTLVLSYEDMAVFPCDPTEEETNFKYPGADIKENARTYTVSLEIFFDEIHRIPTSSEVFSKLNVRYIGADKKLKILKSYEDKGLPPAFVKNKKFKKEFRVRSGYPLYLSVYGAGFEIFNTKVSLTAQSDDGVVDAPVLEYTAQTHRDGYEELSPFCKKVILP